jgi:hypothetical protein
VAAGVCTEGDKNAVCQNDLRGKLRHDEAFPLSCSIAASGEAQGGWENGRTAGRVPSSQQDLAPKIARHGADEDGRIFIALLLNCGLGTVAVPARLDYTMRLENADRAQASN